MDNAVLLKIDEMGIFVIRKNGEALILLLLWIMFGWWRMVWVTGRPVIRLILFNSECLSMT